jgi:ribosomal protein S12 methylthiotransferase
MSHRLSVAIVTLGCPKNEVDSDRMAAAIERSAYRLVGDPDDADVVVLNTCSFIQPATEESISEAFALTNTWRTAAKGRRVIVAGCMVSRYGSALAEAMPEPDAFVSVAEEDTILDVIETLTGIAPTDALAPGAAPVADHRPLRTRPSGTAYLKITEGCDRHCSYCTIPSIRGRFISASADSVLAEARFLIAERAREIVLVGQDIARYGREAGGRSSLAALVSDIDALAGNFRIRLMYVQPDGIDDRLLDVMAASTRVCHYLDIPLQHASGSILKAMRRTGDAEHHLRLLERVRTALPDVTLRTTVMSGFPGETDEDHEILEEFVTSAGFDYVGVFAYSAEEGTRAAGLPGQVPAEVAAERAQRLRDIADAVGFARATRRIGGVEQAIVEGIDEDGALVGRTCAQAPDVDGITFIECSADDASCTPGSLVTVRITDAVGYDVVGVPL